MEERIQKLISASGAASRREAEAMIKDGRVTLNGKEARLGEKADPEKDELLIDGKPLPNVQARVYVMLNKPRGYITSVSDDRGRKTVMELLPETGERLYPVGRLDMDSEGLLILTNDGEFANLLMHPSKGKEKTYRVTVSGRFSGVEKLEEPMEIDGKMTRPAKVTMLARKSSGAVLEVRIQEGRNRQIRRLCENAGLEVTRLKRVSLGNLRLGSLKPGQWRYLTEAEVNAVRAMKK
ncbi:MAG: rRNA pseudouridine synthase [Oscillospiraceae bacterium]|nr:rRNA pseudouridine synthase [Oscillospiraceae bacterium]